MKILVLKPSSLGDIVQAIPVVRLIRQHHPESQIHWWINREWMPLLERDPDIHQLVPFDRRRWGTPSGWPEAFQTILRLREEHFDWVIDLQSLARSALLGWTVGGSLTVGLADSREGAPAFFDFAVPRPFPRAHAVDWYLEVLRTLNVPVHLQFDWLPQNAEARTVVESIWPSEGARWVALQPGARWDNKRWPVEFYAELAVQLLGEVPDLRVVVLGGNSDRALGKIIAARAGQRCINLTGRLTLPTLVEWLRRSSLLVTNDTGPMHLAGGRLLPGRGLIWPHRSRLDGSLRSTGRGHPVRLGMSSLPETDLPVSRYPGVPSPHSRFPGPIQGPAATC